MDICYKVTTLVGNTFSTRRTFSTAESKLLENGMVRQLFFHV